MGFLGFLRAHAGISTLSFFLVSKYLVKFVMVMPIVSRVFGSRRTTM